MVADVDCTNFRLQGPAVRYSRAALPASQSSRLNPVLVSAVITVLALVVRLLDLDAEA